MPNFTISPTTGAGGYLATEVSVTPTSQNTTTNDRTTIVSVQGGSATKQAQVVHFGIPSLVLVEGSTNVPANGGTLKYQIKTHYPFIFKNIPSWVHITDSNGNIYTGDTRYNANLTEGRYFFFSVDANSTPSQRQSTNFYMGHYYTGSESPSTTYTAPISLTQPAGATEYLNVNPVSVVFDWDDSGSTSQVITISSNVSWVATLNDTRNHYQIVGASTGTGNGTITLKTRDINPMTAEKIPASVTISGASITKNVSIEQLRQPRLIYNGTTTLGEITIPDTGGSINVVLTSDYIWWFEQASGQHQNPSFSTQYMTLTDNGTPVVPPLNSSSAFQSQPSGKTYGITWTLNDGQPRNDSLNFAYLRSNNTQGYGYRNFSNVHQDYVVVPRISVDTDNLIFDWWDNTATTRSIRVTTNQPEWTYTTSHNLGEFTFVKNGNYLEITPVGQNSSNGAAAKYVDITFSANSVTCTGKATQYSRPSVREVSGGISKTIPATGATIPMYVTSNYDWWIVTGFETDSYLSVWKGESQVSVFDSNNPYGALAGTESFDFVFAANNTSDNRPPNGLSYFQVRYYDRSGNTRTDGWETNGWQQLASETPVADSIVLYSGSSVTTGGVVSSAASLTTSINVVATNNWTLSKPAADTWYDWYKSIGGATPATGGTEGTTTLYRKILGNSGSSRTGTTTFTCGTASTTYTLTQEATAPTPPVPTQWSANPANFYELEPYASPTLQTEITAPAAWTASTEWSSWIQILTYNGNAGTTTFSFYVTANNSGGPREGNIQIKDGNGVTRITINVEQDELY